MRLRGKSPMILSLLMQLVRKMVRRIMRKMMKAMCRVMADSTSKEMTPEELRDFIESMPEGTVVSVEIKVVLEDG